MSAFSIEDDIAQTNFLRKLEAELYFHSYDPEDSNAKAILLKSLEEKGEGAFVLVPVSGELRKNGIIGEMGYIRNGRLTEHYVKANREGLFLIGQTQDNEEIVQGPYQSFHELYQTLELHPDRYGIPNENQIASKVWSVQFLKEPYYQESINEVIKEKMLKEGEGAFILCDFHKAQGIIGTVAVNHKNSFASYDILANKMGLYLFLPVPTPEDLHKIQTFGPYQQFESLYEILEKRNLIDRNKGMLKDKKSQAKPIILSQTKKLKELPTVPLSKELTALIVEKLKSIDTCPLSLELMEDPVTTVDGQTYERDFIKEALRLKKTSPSTNLPLDSIELLPNLNLKGQKELLENNNVNKVQDCFVCPLTKQVMNDPVIAHDGWSYERSAIEKYFLEHKGDKELLSPKTGKAFVERNSTKLIPNIALKNEIDEYTILLENEQKMKLKK